MIIGCIFCLWHHISLSSSRQNAGPSDLFWVPVLLKVPSKLFWVPVLLKGPSDLFWVPVLLKGLSDLFWVPVLLKVCFCVIVEVYFLQASPFISFISFVRRTCSTPIYQFYQENLLSTMLYTHLSVLSTLAFTQCAIVLYIFYVNVLEM